MIFGNKAPETAVFTVVTAVAHHEVIVLLDSILVGFHAVDDEIIAILLNIIARSLRRKT